MAGFMADKSKLNKKVALNRKLYKITKCTPTQVVGDFEEWKSESRIEFEACLKPNGIDPSKPPQGCMEKFILSKELQTWEKYDPPELPGLNYAAAICLGEDYYEADHFQFLSQDGKEKLKRWLKSKHAKTDMSNRFEGRHAIMKVLPSEGMRQGYARREITILSGLEHANIVQLYDSHIPEHGHGIPWMVTEFCEHLTVRDLVSLYASGGEMVPELFVWQIFESLAQVVQYCHHGLSSCKVWDRVSHRDIISSNVFTKADRLAKSAKPEVDTMYGALEGSAPTEAADVFEIGVVMWCLFCLKETPDADLTGLVWQRWQKGYEQYSKELGEFIVACLETKPEKRPSANALAEGLVATRGELVKKDRLRVERLYSDPKYPLCDH
ncbi:kinase-like domain-containing protein [Paraphoma chrysanthemicola]|nr:kinase-like domain-containing protein [Paraphoma chrysanthemicola]